MTPADLELIDLTTVMSLPSGRRFMWSLLEQLGWLAPSFHVDAAVMAFNEGRRSAAVALAQTLQSRVPLLYLSMFEEAQREAMQAAAREQAAANEEPET